MIAIYKITNTTNGKIYIGSSGNYRKRLQKWRDWRNCAHNPRLIYDFETIGFDKFSFEVVQELPPGTTRQERERIEYDWIHRLQPEYNTIGKQRPPETIQTIVEKRRGVKQPREVVERRTKALRERYSRIPRDGSCTFKPVYVVETGETFESVKAATAALGCADGCVSRALKHPNYTVRGYHVRYLECRD